MSCARATVETLTAHGGAAGGTRERYVAPLGPRMVGAAEATRAMEEMALVERAPLRVVALGRSGVGKSHVLNALLRELARREAGTTEAVEDDGGALEISSVVDHDQTTEEAEADKVRRLEDEGEDGGRVALEENAQMFAPPPPLDEKKQAKMYVPRHMRGREIRGDAFKDSEFENIRKEKIKAAVKKSKKGQKVKPSYVLYKEYKEEEAKAEAERVAAVEKRRRYDEMIERYEIPLRGKPFEESPDPPAEFMSEDVDMPFLLPEGDVMDTTSVASSVSTSDAFRVTLVYFNPVVVKRHIHALRYVARINRALQESHAVLGAYAATFVRKEMQEQGLDDTTLLDFREKPKEGESSADYGYGLPLELRVACSMVGLDPNTTSLGDVDEDELGLPEEYIERLGKRVVFEYKPKGVAGDEVDYSDEETFQRALKATKRTIWTQTHTPSACWGLLREVRIDIPVPPENRDLVLIDAPGAGDTDPARERHLVAALRNAAAIICLGDSREVTGDVVRALHKSGFLQQLVTRPATRRLINAVQGDRIWGDTLTTLRKAQAMLRDELGRDVSIEELAEEQPPKDPDFQWAIDKVINQNTYEIATVRRGELLRMLTDPSGSVGESKLTANAVIAVAWRFTEIRTSWSRVLDASKVDVHNTTGHGSLYAILDELKRARALKLYRRATWRVHNALKTFCIMTEPLSALPTSSDDSLRGFHEEIEFRLGDNGSYAGRKVWEAAFRFCRDIVSSGLSEHLALIEHEMIKSGSPDFVRKILVEKLNMDQRRDEIKSQDDIAKFVSDAAKCIYDISTTTLFEWSDSVSSDNALAKGLLYVMCDNIVQRWNSLMVKRGIDGFESTVRKQLEDLVGDEMDPDRALMRSFIQLAMMKFKLGPAADRAYLVNSTTHRSVMALWQECRKKIISDITKQLKNITVAIMCAHQDNESGTPVPTPEGVEAFMQYTINAFSASTCTTHDLLLDTLERTVTQWFETPAKSASEDAHRACIACIHPFAKKQVMPEFRTVAARPQMLSLIDPDLQRVQSLLKTTTSVLGMEVEPPPDKAEKLRNLIALSNLGSRPYVLSKIPLPRPPSAAIKRSSDDDMRVGLDEFPLKVYMPTSALDDGSRGEKDEENESVEETQMEDASTEDKSRSPQVESAAIPSGRLPIEMALESDPIQRVSSFFNTKDAQTQKTTPTKDVQMQTEPMEGSTSVDAEANSSVRLREVAVQTDDDSLTMMDVMDATDDAPSTRIQAPKGVMERMISSSKSEDTATPTTNIVQDAKTVAKQGPSNFLRSTPATSAKRTASVTDLHAPNAYRSKRRLKLAVTPSKAPAAALTSPHPDVPIGNRTNAQQAAGATAESAVFDFESDQELEAPLLPTSLPTTSLPTTSKRPTQKLDPQEVDEWKRLDPLGSKAGLSTGILIGEAVGKKHSPQEPSDLLYVQFTRGLSSTTPTPPKRNSVPAKKRR